MTKHVNIILTLISIVVYSTSFSQTNSYSTIRKNVVHWTCSQTKSDSVELTLKDLLSVDTSAITDGLYDYYYDLAMTYYIKALGYKQREFYDLMIASYMKCISIDKKRGGTYYNLAFVYHFDKQYDLAKNNIKLYKKYTKKKNWDNEFIDKIEKSD